MRYYHSLQKAILVWGCAAPELSPPCGKEVVAVVQSKEEGALGLCAQHFRVYSQFLPSVSLRELLEEGLMSDVYKTPPN